VWTIILEPLATILDLTRQGLLNYIDCQEKLERETPMSSVIRNTGYVFDNAGAETQARFAALPRIFDPGTIRHLEDLGVGPSWNCLEMGGGGGSIAKWLCERVTPTGYVLVTDIDTRFLEQLRLSNLEVRQHNIVTDPLPERAFDLAHARLVLAHVPERNMALRKLISVLRPGGWILLEELADREIDPPEKLLRTYTAMMKTMTANGVDLHYGRKIIGLLRAEKLVEVSSEGRIFMWTGRSSGAALLRANFEQLREAMIVSGLITEQQFAEDVAHLEGPNFIMPSPILWATWGRVPLQ